MKYIIILIAAISFNSLQAQNFIDKGLIEYTVVVNNHKAMGEGRWAEMFKDKIPKLSTSYYQLTFNDNKGTYLFNRKEDKTRSPFGNDAGEESVWYSDYANDKFIQQKVIFGNTYLLSDSLLNINWKMTNESRNIAGFNCRKAVGVLFDSVYVFAFYTDEITVSGGPMGLHGLPGMILGVTIPRMFSSWVANKIIINGVDFTKINAPTKGKKKKPRELEGTIIEATKDWGSYGQQAIWNMFL
ncbi:MAG: GLPGLI family protein [Ferruginibacter sp.]